MLRNFYPSCSVKNVFQIDYAELYENGNRQFVSENPSDRIKNSYAFQ